MASRISLNLLFHAPPFLIKLQTKCINDFYKYCCHDHEIITHLFFLCSGKLSCPLSKVLSVEEDSSDDEDEEDEEESEEESEAMPQHLVVSMVSARAASSGFFSCE